MKGTISNVRVKETVRTYHPVRDLIAQLSSSRILDWHCLSLEVDQVVLEKMKVEI
jgi:hypothetical protein